MAGVSRFSRPAQVAKFNPLSTQEVMAVPMAKEALEQSQRAESEAYLQELYKTRSVEGDAPEINAEKDALEQEMNTLAGDITKNGISNQSTERLMQLKRKYGKALSASGRIGQANTFVGLQEQARQEFVTNKANQEYGTDYLNKYWNESVKGRSAFAEDGAFKTEFEGVGLPTFKNAGDSLRAIAAKSPGSFRRTADGHILYGSNKKQLANMKEEVLARYNSPLSNEHRSMIAQDLTIEDIEAALDNAEAGLLNETTGTITPKAPKALTTSQLKDKKDNFIQYNETVLNNSGVRMLPFEGIANSINEMQDNATMYYRRYLDALASGDEALASENSEAYQEALKLNEKVEEAVRGQSDAAQTAYDKMLSLYEETSPKFKQLLEGASLDLIVSDEGKVTLEDGRGVDYINAQLGNDILNKGTNKEEVNKAVKGIKDFADAKELYKSTIDDSLTENSKQRILSGRTFSSMNKETNDQWKRWQTNLQNTISASPNAFKILSTTGPNGDREIETNFPGKEDGESFQANSFEYVKNSDEFVVKNMIPAGAHGNAMIEVELEENVSDDDGKNKEKFKRTMWLQINDDGGGVATESLSTQLGSINNKDLQVFAEKTAAYNDYGKVIIAPSYKKNNLYLHSDDINEYFDVKGTGKAETMFKDKDADYDIYKSKDGSYQFGIRSKDGARRDLTIGELTEQYFNSNTVKDDTEQDDKYLLYHLKQKIINDREYPKFTGSSVEQHQINIDNFFMRKLNEFRTSQEPVKVDNYYDFFKLFK